MSQARTVTSSTDSRLPQVRGLDIRDAKATVASDIEMIMAQIRVLPEHLPSLGAPEEGMDEITIPSFGGVALGTRSPFAAPEARNNYPAKAMRACHCVLYLCRLQALKSSWNPGTK